MKFIHISWIVLPNPYPLLKKNQKITFHVPEQCGHLESARDVFLVFPFWACCMFLTQVLVQCQNVQQHQKTELMNKNKRIVEIKNNPGLKITASRRTMTGQIKVLYSQLHGWQDICPAVYACKEKFNSGLTSDLNTAFLYKHQRNTI